MNHSEMVALIRDGGMQQGEVWADLGAGTGNFTRALAELLGPMGTVYGLDRDGKAIAAQRAHAAVAGAAIVLLQADVTGVLDLPQLDGILMANLLHFVRDQPGLLRRLSGYLRPGGRVLVVEYDQKLPIPWVPFPVPPARFAELATAAGLAVPSQVGQRRSPSSGRAMYAAVAVKP